MKKIKYILILFGVVIRCIELFLIFFLWEQFGLFIFIQVVNVYVLSRIWLYVFFGQVVVSIKLICMLMQSFFEKLLFIEICKLEFFRKKIDKEFVNFVIVS